MADTLTAILQNRIGVLLALFPVLYLSIFLHEVGHALMGRISGYVVAAFGTGLGPPVWVVKVLGTRIYFGLRKPTQGLTWLLCRQLNASKRSQIAMLSGGILVNLLVGLAAGLLWLLLWSNEVLLLTSGINLYFGLTNLIPFSFRVGQFTHRSDGAQILQILREGKTDRPAASIITLAKSLSPFWEAIGCTQIHRIYLLAAAESWLSLGDVEQAQSFFEQAILLPRGDSSSEMPIIYPIEGAIEELVRSKVARSIGKLEESSQALDRAGVLFAGMADQIGTFHVAMERSRLTWQMGDQRVAVSQLESLQNQPLLRQWPALGLAVVEELIRVHCLSDDAAQVGQLLPAYEQGQRRFASATSALFIYQTLAAFYARQSDWPRAESAYRLALGAARKLLEEFADPEDQARFHKAQQVLLIEAEHCLRQHGKDEEAGKLKEELPSPEELVRLKAARDPKSLGWRENLGQLATLMNLVVGVLLVLMGTINELTDETMRHVDYLVAPGLVLVAFGCVAAVYMCFLTLQKWLLPRKKMREGVMLYIAFAGWCFSAGVVVSNAFR